MASLLTSIAQGVGGLSSLFGLLGSSAAQRRAEQAREAALAQLSSLNDAQYQNSLGQASRDTLSAAGMGGDALHALGARLGDSLSGAGVYDSSATAGALVNAQQREQSQLAALAQSLADSAADRHLQGSLTIGRLGLGEADAQSARAGQQADTAQDGFAGYLTALARWYAEQNAVHGGSSSGGFGVYGPPIDLSGMEAAGAQTVPAAPQPGSPAALGQVTQQNIGLRGGDALSALLAPLFGRSPSLVPPAPTAPR